MNKQEVAGRTPSQQLSLHHGKATSPVNVQRKNCRPKMRCEPRTAILPDLVMGANCCANTPPTGGPGEIRVEWEFNVCLLLFSK